MDITDARGPQRTIIEVLEPRKTARMKESGLVIPVKLSCGHTVERNASFMYRVGDENRCLECR